MAIITSNGTMTNSLAQRFTSDETMTNSLAQRFTSDGTMTNSLAQRFTSDGTMTNSRADKQLCSTQKILTANDDTSRCSIEDYDEVFDQRVPDEDNNIIRAQCHPNHSDEVCHQLTKITVYTRYVINLLR